MRLFVAIPLSDNVRTKLVNLQQTLPEGVQKQPVEQIHITLRFLGETSTAKAEIIKNRLHAIEASDFKLAVEGAGAFPNKSRPKIIWSGVEKSNPLMELQKKLKKYV